MVNLIAFCWGLAEATFFFLIPDIYLTRIAIDSYKKALVACFIAAIGAVIGGMLMYAWGSQQFYSAYLFLTYVPAIFPALILKVAVLTESHPMHALFMAPFAGIPYKIFAVILGSERYPVGLFIFVSFLARLTRFLMTTLIAIGATAYARNRLQHKTLIRIHAAVWLFIYIFYFYITVYHYA